MTIVTWAAPALSIVCLGPIAWRPVADRGVAGISVGAAIATAVTVQLWLTYGLLIGDSRQIVVNTANCLVRGAIMLAVLWSLRDARARTAATGAVLGAGLAAFAGPTAVGLLGTSFSTVNRLPQAAHTIRKGAGAGLSVAAFSLGVLADLSWGCYGLVNHQPIVVLSSSLAATFDTLIVLAATRPSHALVARLRAQLEPQPSLTELVGYGVVAGD